MEMPNPDFWDALDASLAGLRVHDADPEPVERIRARCVAALGPRPTRHPPDAWRRWIEPAVACCLGALYLAVVASQALPLLL